MLRGEGTFCAGHVEGFIGRKRDIFFVCVFADWCVQYRHVRTDCRWPHRGWPPTPSCSRRAPTPSRCRCSKRQGPSLDVQSRAVLNSELYWLVPSRYLLEPHGSRVPQHGHSTGYTHRQLPCRRTPTSIQTTHVRAAPQEGLDTIPWRRSSDSATFTTSLRSQGRDWARCPATGVGSIIIKQ